MYNLHCHSLLSDGALLPSEVAVRYMTLGYKAIAITDHVDYCNIESTIKAILNFTRNWPRDAGLIRVLPGIELTHLAPKQFKPLARYARAKGIKVIVAHGETVAEPVIKGTNQAALEADIDILAHPGLISEKEIALAKKKGIFLEVTSRKGHADTNNYVVERALKLGAKLVLNTDSHEVQDIISQEQLIDAAHASGLSNEHIDKICHDLVKFLKERGVR